MKCASNLRINETKCLPKCSGLQISSFDQESIQKNKELLKNMDTAFKMQLKILDKTFQYALPAALTSWSKNCKH